MLTPSVTREKQHPQSLREQEEEKKQKYQQRVLEVEMGLAFTPLVFGTNGGMGADCGCSNA